MSDLDDAPDERLPHLEVDSKPEPDRDDISYAARPPSLPSPRVLSRSQSIRSTISARDSVFQNIQENGRTYHSYSAGSYFLPNDAVELDRLYLQYHVVRNVIGQREHLAPIQNPREILDIGTGAGEWVMDMARKFPNAQVTGSDISATFMQCNLPNVHWILEDASRDDWGSKRYDYIHTRVMMGCFNDFREVIQKSYDYLQPGGWMESQELYSSVFCDDGTLDRENNAFYRYMLKFDEAAMDAGKPLRIANKLKNWYQQAGFVDVQEEVFKIPINGWPKDPRFKMVGRFWADSLVQGLQGFCLALFTRVWGWSKDEVEVYLVPVRQAIMDRNVHAYHKFYVVWGRKPTVEEMRLRDQTALRVKGETAFGSKGKGKLYDEVS